MKGQTQHTKLRAGSGFTFEDNVGAYFLACILTGHSPLSPSLGTISRADFQVDREAWPFDDLLITLDSSHEQFRCSFSVKSNQQFTQYSAPPDFVKDCWKVLIQDQPTTFNKSSDRFGLITAPLPIKVQKSITDLLNKAENNDPLHLHELFERGSGIAREKQRLYSSFACPESLLEKIPVSEPLPGEILKRVVFLQFDFENPNSIQLQEVISFLRNALLSHSTEEAENLWESLLAITSKLRINGGGVDLPDLLDKLRSRYLLSDHPEYSRDWSKLDEWTDYELRVIRNTIGGKVFLPRETAVDALQKMLNEKRAVVILGASGSGKTVATKTFAEAQKKRDRVLWIQASSLDCENFKVFEYKFKLAYTLRDVIRAVASPSAYLIIDALDRTFSEASFKNLSMLIEACCLDSPESPWKLVITCQPEEWARTQGQLRSANISAELTTLPFECPKGKEIDPVWDTFPELSWLKLQRHLEPVLSNPKILDLLTTKAQEIDREELGTWIGESEIIPWFWESIVKKGINGFSRSRILMDLAQKQGDELLLDTPASAFSISEHPLLGELVHDRLLRTTPDEKISFDHDLYGDWARLRVLEEHSGDLDLFLKDRILSPLWCRALRLYGLSLLEQEGNTSKWKAILESFSRSGEKIAIDLIIESTIFASNPYPLFEMLWPEFRAEKGHLLRRFLRRFLHTATLPNPLVLAVLRHEFQENMFEDSTLMRIPYWPYWLPIVKFLHAHKDEVIDLSQNLVAQITDKWLRFSSVDWPLRKEVAELAVEVGDEMLAFKMSDGINIVNDKVDEDAFRAALAAANEFPERVASFALTACARKDPPERIIQRIVRLNEEGKRFLEDLKRGKPATSHKKIPPPIVSLDYEKEPLPPWPDGPKGRVDSAFQNVCLNTDALYPLIVSNPDLAQEIILALSIKEPRRKTRGRSLPGLDSDFGLDLIRGWYPPFYTRGPFLSFLKTNPQAGLSLIIRLINFATERWADLGEGKSKPPTVKIKSAEVEEDFMGNGDVFYWYRGITSNIITSALMALEKWFYDTVEDNGARELIENSIDRIIKEGESLAFLGVLCALGKKKPDLFLTKLKFLLSVPEFYFWDQQFVVSGENLQMMSWGLPNQQSVIKAASEWHSLPHRRTDLLTIAIDLFLKSPLIQEYYETVKSEWRRRLAEGIQLGGTPAYLENLQVYFDSSNWEERLDPSVGKVQAFAPPKELIQKREPSAIESEQDLFITSLPLVFLEELYHHKESLKFTPDVVWEKIQWLLALEDSNDRADSFQIMNSLLAGIALLLQRHRDWLRNDPQKETWCVDLLTNTVLNPPKHDHYEGPHGIARWHWDRFAALAIPLLWAENPGDPKLRKCVALLAISQYNETVSFLFASASTQRALLGDGFKKLQDLALRWAEVEWQYRTPNLASEWSNDILVLREAEANAFAEYTSSKVTPKWKKAGRKAEPEWYVVKGATGLKLRKRRHRDYPEFSLAYIKSAFSWIPSLEDSLNEAERSHWVAFWKEALEWTLFMLGEDDEEDESISETPTGWDIWVLERIASLLFQLKPEEAPESFWRPILNLASPAHYWLQDFFQSLFSLALSEDEPPFNFMDLWRKMIDFASNSDRWKIVSGKRWYYVEEIWWELMGLDFGVNSLWKASHETLVTKMTYAYERWAKTYLVNESSAVRFVEFLGLPAAKGITFLGLVWLNDALERAYWFSGRDRDQLQERLASLLGKVWTSRNEELRRNTVAFDAFKNLLKKLITLQNSLAFEIQARLISSRSI